MPVRIEINPSAQLVRATVSGSVNLTAAEFVAFLDAVIAHPDFRPGFDFLYDRRAVAEPPDPASVRAALGAIEQEAGRLGGSRWAVLIGPRAALEMVRMAALLNERAGVEARPFVTPADALAWLGHPPEENPGG